MGFDLVGRRPRASTGRYYRVTGLSWGPLWDFTCELAGDEILPETWEYGQGNDGHLVRVAEARAMARCLERALSDGTVDRLARTRENQSLGFTRELVRTFKNFCRSSGGFRIY